MNLRITILCPESSQAIPLSVLPDLKHLVISLLLIRCFHRIFMISSSRSYPDRPNILSPLGQSRPTVLWCKNVTSPTGGSTYLTSYAQCAFWVLRWPCGQKLKSKNTLSDGKKIFLRLFFLCCLRKKTLKLVSLFIFRH